MGRTNRTTPAQLKLGQRVRRLRLAKGMSQIDLAGEVDLHFTFVSEVERGLRNLSLSSLLLLADGLGVNPAELVDGLHF